MESQANFLTKNINQSISESFNGKKLLINMPSISRKSIEIP